VIPVKLAAVGLGKLAATVAASGPRVSRELGADVQAAVQAGDATPATQWEELARRARGEGAGKLAEALGERAAAARAPATSGREGAPETEPPADDDSPPGGDGLQLPRSKWERLREALAGDRAVSSEERGRVGRYAMSVKRLADLGLVSDVRRVRGDDDSGSTWAGTWRPRARSTATRAPSRAGRRPGPSGERSRGTARGSPSRACWQ
jgi:hypothetical protein